MERRCRLSYYMGISISDQDNMDVAEIDWVYGWLTQQKEKEAKGFKE